jgi:hypothetical protein
MSSANVSKKAPKSPHAIEWFVSPHTINGKGTFAFLHRQLQRLEPGRLQKKGPSVLAECRAI